MIKTITRINPKLMARSPPSEIVFSAGEVIDCQEEAKVTTFGTAVNKFFIHNFFGGPLTLTACGLASFAFECSRTIGSTV